ncbi:MAG: 2-hydroxyacyl-CoA dehydratase [Deltaproteobacteria bacterium]|nr:2-hydroxyacyl-CoA dehydratase [Deltaproteobacteria bacterium]
MPKLFDHNQSIHDEWPCRIGIDIGSTTAKVIVLNGNDNILFTDYRRHDALISQTLMDIFQDLSDKLGDLSALISITGSAGMGISEWLSIPFIQEVIASAEVVQRFYPDVRTLLDIGGEDSKLIFFNDQGRADIRMNGNCAGGTGAFIDQMATLIGVPCEDLNRLAEGHESIHNIASRCGVFAKTDIQALMSRGVSRPDIAASIFHAIALQTISALSKGFVPEAKVLFIGGPLTFIPMLRKVMREKMGLNESDVLVPEHPEFFPAIGAAISSGSKKCKLTISAFLDMLTAGRRESFSNEDYESPLFNNINEFTEWERHRFAHVETVDLLELDGKRCFLGIDSGSTTTKTVLIDDIGRIGLEYYIPNRGEHVSAVQECLSYFSNKFRENRIYPKILGTAVTGYGEDLIKKIFGIDRGIVETLAHYRAARHLVDDVSFILDIGGQDMKAMYVENGYIRKIEINEACSSGCGTFLQSFAEILNCPVSEFSVKACTSSSPCNLGSRCTVFMNSRVKQSLRDGAAIEDMAAGLAYSVIRNCLNKVLKIKDMSTLGEKIVVQGGTFLNPSVHRAFEKLTGKKVYCPDVSGIMGAFGCALLVRDSYMAQGNSPEKILDLDKIARVGNCAKSFIHCEGCTNRCIVTKLVYDNGSLFYSGNRCERIFSNGEASSKKGYNLAEYQSKLLFSFHKNPSGESKLIIGIPRSLNIYENYPFWCTLFAELGVEVRLSSRSSGTIYEKGAGTVMSDSICFPAKMTHGHIIDLIGKKVDRIFYPIVVYEQHDQKGFNCYNCPIVTGYPEVIKSAINPEGRYGIPFDTPVISFRDISLLEKICREYIGSLKIGRKGFKAAFKKALNAQKEYKTALRKKAEETVAKASRDGRKVIMLVGRPYHMDGYINHGIPDMLARMGMDVITSDSTPITSGLDDVRALTQWAFSNRLYQAAKYTNMHDNMETVQLNSFGCGLDAIATDVLVEILSKSGKNLTVLRIDEIDSPGSIRLRLRTLVETLKVKKLPSNIPGVSEDIALPIFREEDRHRKIIVPFFSNFHSPFVKSALQEMGYDFEVLDPPNKESLEVGLKYTNNEICYPAIIVVGDILKALQSGRYDLGHVAVGITQTGAQCRASNYVTLIKKGLLGAGFSNIPVVTVHFKNDTLNDQPGFSFSRYKLSKTGLFSLAFADSLSLIYHPVLVREEKPGSAWNLVQKHLDLWFQEKDMNQDKAITHIAEAVKDFNNLPVHEGSYPRIGIVGEIYAKYNDFCNYNVVSWLARHGVEVEIPCLINFFTQGFINNIVDIKEYLDKRNIFIPLNNLVLGIVNRFLKHVDGVLEGFKFYKPFPVIKDIAEKASRVIDLANQFGEGWLIPGEVLSLAERGVENILCLQPFGCIANQVIGKGIEKKLRELSSNLNILFLDLDANTSKANFFNRLHFLVQSARITEEFNSSGRIRYA